MHEQGGRGRYLVCVSADGNPKGPCQTKVSELDLPLGVDEEILGLQVSMKNPVRVAEGQALQQLEKITLKMHTKIYINTQVSQITFDFLLRLRQICFAKVAEMYLNQRQWDTSDCEGVHELL